jgi:peptidoglycan-N-acetylglucosamine deacetylase
LNWAKESGKIYLTFDDGPEISTTDKILDSLKAHQIQATFFVLGENVERYPVLFQRIVNEGHTIGIHGFAHLHPWKVWPWRGFSDLAKGVKTLKQNGIKTCYIRPPYGKLNMLSLLYILLNRMTFIHWDLDPRDYNQVDAEILSELLRNENCKGSVILLHDGRRPGTSSGQITVSGLAHFLDNKVTTKELFCSLPPNGLNLYGNK